MRVISGASRTDIVPVGIQALQFVLEPVALRVHKAQGRVANFEVVLTRRDPQRTVKRDRRAIEQKRFDQYGRRLGIGGHRFRVKHGDTILGGKPELAIPRFDTRRPAAAITFHIQHAIAPAVDNRGDGAARTGSEPIELLLAHAVDAAIAAHPEVAASIFEDLENAVVE